MRHQISYKPTRKNPHLPVPRRLHKLIDAIQRNSVAVNVCAAEAALAALPDVDDTTQRADRAVLRQLIRRSKKTGRLDSSLFGISRKSLALVQTDALTSWHGALPYLRPRTGHDFIQVSCDLMPWPMLAHLSGDPLLADALREGNDPYAMVARKIGVSRELAKRGMFAEFFVWNPKNLEKACQAEPDPAAALKALGSIPGLFPRAAAYAASLREYGDDFPGGVQVAVNRVVHDVLAHAHGLVGGHGRPVLLVDPDTVLYEVPTDVAAALCRTIDGRVLYTGGIEAPIHAEVRSTPADPWWVVVTRTDLNGDDMDPYVVGPFVDEKAAAAEANSPNAGAVFSMLAADATFEGYVAEECYWTQEPPQQRSLVVVD